MVGPGSKVAEAIPELFPTLDVETVPGELLALAGTKICWGGGTIAGVALQHGRLQIFNPVDSGHIITITRVQWSHDVTGPISWGNAVAALGFPISTQRFRDIRFGFTNLPIGQVHQATFVGFPNGINQTLLIANESQILEDDNGVCVLPPSFAFEFGSRTPNASVFYSVDWRERPAEQSELNLGG